MPEMLSDEEFENFKGHLRAHRDLATDGGATEPDDELVRILSMHQIFLISDTIEEAAALLGVNAVVVSESARQLGMNKPYVSVHRGDF